MLPRDPSECWLLCHGAVLSGLHRAEADVLRESITGTQGSLSAEDCWVGAVELGQRLAVWLLPPKPPVFPCFCEKLGSFGIKVAQI